MTARTRLVVFLVTGPIIALVLFWGLCGLPRFGHHASPYGDALNAVSVRERNVTDVVTAVNFDYRGFDTLGEEFIFFAAVIGVVLILREQRDEYPGHVEDFATGHAVPPTSDAVRVLGLGLTPLTVLFGIDLITHGQLTPGGGFQGGVVLATAVLLIYLAGEYDDLHGLYRETILERAEALGAAAYIALGAVGLVVGDAFLQNVLPLGRARTVFSAGTVPLINLAVGIEIAAGFVILLTNFLHQTLVVRPAERPSPLARALGRGARST